MTTEELKQMRQERSGQRLNIGDRVKAYDFLGNLLYGGKTAVIAEKALLAENEYYFGIYVEGVTDVKRDGSGKAIGYTSFFAPFYAEGLELVKEPKPKFKVGDKVEIDNLLSAFDGRVGVIAHILIGETVNYCVKIQNDIITVDEASLCPYTEPTAEEGEAKEQRIHEAEKELQERMADHLDRMKSPEKYYTYTIEPPAWQSYRMELAAKIAVAYAEKGRYEPEEIGAKAVEVANGVVERLKNSKV